MTEVLEKGFTPKIIKYMFHIIEKPYFLENETHIRSNKVERTKYGIETLLKKPGIRKLSLQTVQNLH